MSVESSHRMHRIHSKHVLDDLSSSGMSAGQGWGGGGETIPLKIRKLPKKRNISMVLSGIQGAFHQIEWTEFINNILLMVYQVLKSLQAIDEVKDEEIISPKTENSLNNENISMQLSRIQGKFHQTECSEFIKNIFWMICQVLGSLQAIAEVKEGNQFPQWLEITHKWEHLNRIEWVIGVEPSQRMHRIH